MVSNKTIMILGAVLLLVAFVAFNTSLSGQMTGLSVVSSPNYEFPGMGIILILVICVLGTLVIRNKFSKGR